LDDGFSGKRMTVKNGFKKKAHKYTFQSLFLEAAIKRQIKPAIANTKPNTGLLSPICVPDKNPKTPHA
jgi:hypothetical protein